MAAKSHIRDGSLSTAPTASEAAADLDFVGRTSSSRLLNRPLEILKTGHKRGRKTAALRRGTLFFAGAGQKGMAYHGGSIRVSAIFWWRQSVARFSFARQLPPALSQGGFIRRADARGDCDSGANGDRAPRRLRSADRLFCLCGGV